MAAKPKLTPEAMLFVVEQNAEFRTPSEVAAAVKEHFGIEITPQTVQLYHPRRHAGRKLKKELVEHFDAHREKFAEDVTDIPRANRAFRIKELSEMAEAAAKAKNYGMAAQLNKQIAEELGNVYSDTRKHQHSGPGGQVLKTPLQAIVYEVVDAKA